MTVNELTEQWRPVSGLEDLLEISDRGRVRSVKTGRLRKPSPGNQYGHLYVTYRLNGKTCIQTVHTMVLEAFVGPRPPGKVCCHNDGDRANNRLENLRWDTQRSNLLDAVRGKTHYWAKRTHCKHNHEYTEENTLVRHKGGKTWRVCRQCERERLAAFYRRKAAA